LRNKSLPKLSTRASSVDETGARGDEDDGGDGGDKRDGGNDVDDKDRGTGDLGGLEVMPGDVDDEDRGTGDGGGLEVIPVINVVVKNTSKRSRRVKTVPALSRTVGLVRSIEESVTNGTVDNSWELREETKRLEIQADADGLAERARLRRLQLESVMLDAKVESEKLLATLDLKKEREKTKQTKYGYLMQKQQVLLERMKRQKKVPDAEVVDHNARGTKGEDEVIEGSQASQDQTSDSGTSSLTDSD
jgi:hypothetical protein